MCGEYSSVFTYHFKATGSPPHVRGIYYEEYQVRTIVRITPACAGNMVYFHHNKHIYWDHPRMCGEYYFRIAPNLLNIGSPPHVRGISLFSSLQLSVNRITPACAGNIISLNLFDYPSRGSPPHVRGIYLYSFT
ncbi:hypothetical protein SYNTR_0944 [Candidatus Syntrophocurvum alkaliphilum]|uniref:Uncharacterized protein n=1 Tax=Candidatus Syntrophocurvum alkaliphilum TaxID=2293317 RepID=A0A6I6DEE5_9FIRM|nr:hypothetical protein SYNTR_0944 [Candidatus Syntrophocurvum alkaliphilum]